MDGDSSTTKPDKVHKKTQKLAPRRRCEKLGPSSVGAVAGKKRGHKKTVVFDRVERHTPALIGDVLEIV